MDQPMTERERTSIEEGIAAWESRRTPTSLTIALTADALYGAQEAIARVKALHEPMPIYALDENGYHVFEDEDRVQIASLCRECTTDELVLDAEDGEWQDDLAGSVEYPCATIRALEGASDE